MLRYEILMLAVPEITQDESKGLEDRLEKIIEKHKGAIVSFERWGKFRLAYPVNKNDYGIYFLIRFEMEQSAGPLLEELKALFAVKLNDLVMRYLVSRLDPSAPLIYQRPQSLEDTPARDVDTFLRENKMEGLLSIDAKKSVSAKATSDRPVSQPSPEASAKATSVSANQSSSGLRQAGASPDRVQEEAKPEQPAPEVVERVEVKEEVVAEEAKQA